MYKKNNIAFLLTYPSLLPTPTLLCLLKKN